MSTDQRLPTGTVTFLFTDIEGSTHLLSTLGDGYAAMLAEHNRLLREHIAGHDGTEVSTEGDAFFAVFRSAVDAVAAVADAQRALAASAGQSEAAIRVRMGVHTGEGRLGGDNYVGLDVHRAARIAAAGHGGQVLLSDTTQALVRRGLRDGLGLRDLGEHRLKDLPEPERIWQLEIDDLPQDFAVLRTLDARSTNLPVPATSLVGRDDELRAVGDLLERRRLVTLTGPGGTGKTRLALAVAGRTQAGFADGVCFVPLQDARDRTAVAAAIAAALSVRERHDRNLEEGVKQYVRDRELLLVLDNFEQVVGSSAPLVAELLSGSSRLRIVVTSRAVLHLSGEQEFRVPPLSIPDPRRLPALAALSDYDAVVLFADRARSVNPDFAVTAVNARSVAEIASRLDGLPLAIELAAARVKVLDPEAILDRLERRLPVLAGGASDLPTRQRTLEGAIGWSYELLDPAERLLFVRLAAFAGGWTLDAADEVCNAEGELGIETLDGLASLVDKSLVHATPGGDGEARFGMLQVIREFAAAKLAQEPEADEIRRRHARHMLALAEAAEPELRRSELRRWQHRLRREEENLRTALRWAAGAGEAEIGLRLAGALWDFWHYWAELREGIGWLESILSLPGSGRRTDARAHGLTGLAGLLYWQGQGDRCWELYEEALAIYRDLGDDRRIAKALHNTAWAAVVRQDFVVAEGRAHEALDRYRAAGDAGNAALVEAWLIIEPVVLGLGGDVNAAVGAASQAVDASRQLGRAHDAADWLAAQALIHRMVGDHHRGVRAARAALAAWHELGNMGRIPLSFKILAALELGDGRPERAARLGAAADRYIEELGGDLYEVFGQLGDPVRETIPLLDPEEHRRAVHEGRSRNLDEQVRFALEPDRGGG